MFHSRRLQPSVWLGLFPNAGTSILGKPWLVFSIIQVILTLWKFDKATEAMAHFVRLFTYWNWWNGTFRKQLNYQRVSLAWETKWLNTRCFFSLKLCVDPWIFWQICHTMPNIPHPVKHGLFHDSRLNFANKNFENRDTCHQRKHGSWNLLQIGAGARPFLCPIVHFMGIGTGSLPLTQIVGILRCGIPGFFWSWSPRLLKGNKNHWDCRYSYIFLKKIITR